MSSTTYKRRSWNHPAPPRPPAPMQEEVAQVPPPAIQTPPPAPVPETEALFEPRELTFEEVCRYLNLKPETRKFFVNKRGEYVRSLVEAYSWTVDQERKVHKIPKWFINNEAW